MTLRLNSQGDINMRTQTQVRARQGEVLSMDAIRHFAPSVFATAPKSDRSENYRFFPTIDVVNGLIKNGFQPVMAGQSRTRDENNRPFTRHIMRFRHTDMFNPAQVGEEVPEIVLLNSHNGSSSYQLDLGFFRLVCANGMIVQSANIASIRTRHSGSPDIVGEVIEGSFKIIEEAPQAFAQVEDWKRKMIKKREQEALAAAAIELRGTSLEVAPSSLIIANRSADMPENKDTGERSIWRSMNVIQENLVRGGVSGINANNRSRRMRGINSVDKDTKFNRALWMLTERLAEQVAA